MSRVVVAGPYPTMPGPESAATFSLVRRLVAAGDDVTVISPVPSAAHHFADPGSPRGAARLAKLLRDAEVLYLRLDAAALAAGAESRPLMAGRLALRVALQRAKERHVRLDRVPGTVSRQFANVVLGQADRVLVTTEGERDALVAAGVDAGRVAVEPEPEMLAAASGATAPRRVVRSADGAVPASVTSAAELQELVRRRALEDRAARRNGSEAAAGEASLPLRHLVRMERPPTRSNFPAGSFVKRSMEKAMRWQFDNVIASVNRLHEATIDAVEALEAEVAELRERDRPVR